jgi:hypothetical protein
MFFNATTGSAAERMAFLDPIGTGTGLITRAGKPVDYAGDLRFDDDSPDFGNPNFSDVSGGFVGIDNLQVLGYGIGTFTNDPDPFIGDSYGVGAFSDDGAVLWVDKDDNGKFERMNSLGQDELIFNDNSDHGPRVTVQQAQIPAGTHRFAAGFYEAGGNGVMDFRISRGIAPTIAADVAATPEREDYLDFKAQMKSISPLDTSIITNMKSVLQSGNFDMTNPITVSGTNNGLRGDGGVKYTNVTLPNGTAVRVGGAMSLVNPVVDGTATINFDNQIDFGIPQPATPGGNLTLLTGGPADLT